MEYEKIDEKTFKRIDTVETIINVDEINSQIVDISAHIEELQLNIDVSQEKLAQLKSLMADLNNAGAVNA